MNLTSYKFCIDWNRFIKNLLLSIHKKYHIHQNWTDKFERKKNFRWMHQWNVLLSLHTRIWTRTQLVTKLYQNTNNHIEINTKKKTHPQSSMYIPKPNPNHIPIHRKLKSIPDLMSRSPIDPFIQSDQNPRQPIRRKSHVILIQKVVLVHHINSQQIGDVHHVFPRRSSEAWRSAQAWRRSWGRTRSVLGRRGVKLQDAEHKDGELMLQHDVDGRPIVADGGRRMRTRLLAMVC